MEVAANVVVTAEGSGGDGREQLPHMMLASTSADTATAAVAVTGVDNFQLYYKQFPGLKTPFGLPIECFPVYEALLDDNPAAVEQVNIMLQGPMAQGTAAGYNSVIQRFHGFCLERGYTFPEFSKDAVIRFMQACLGGRE